MSGHSHNRQGGSETDYEQYFQCIKTIKKESDGARGENARIFLGGAPPLMKMKNPFKWWKTLKLYRVSTFYCLVWRGIAPGGFWINPGDSFWVHEWPGVIMITGQNIPAPGPSILNDKGLTPSTILWEL